MSSQKWCFGCDCNMSHPKAESSTLSLVTTHSCTACRTQRSVETRCWTVSRLMLLWSIFSLSPSTSCAHFRCSRLKTRQLRSPDPGSAGRNPCSVSAARWRPCCGSNVQRWNKSCQRPLSHTRPQDLSAWSQQCTCCETVFLVGEGGCRQAGNTHTPASPTGAQSGLVRMGPVTHCNFKINFCTVPRNFSPTARNFFVTAF